MNALERAKCPKCGSTRIGKGKLSGYAALQPEGKAFSFGSAILTDVCSECGFLFNMYADRPEKFIPR
ncbi:MAG TPA: transcription initiation factor TFIIIB [Clostridiales bacterium]|jgi:predicted Zn-ribbon and HTH transcriptional regulator|nr:transcription initiation factor TFIIIB [Clostridiales bacterium]